MMCFNRLLDQPNIFCEYYDLFEVGKGRELVCSVLYLLEKRPCLGLPVHELLAAHPAAVLGHESKTIHFFVLLFFPK